MFFLHDDGMLSVYIVIFVPYIQVKTVETNFVLLPQLMNVIGFECALSSINSNVKSRL